MIYIARHGETSWNCEKRFQGLLNSPLTDKGRAQMESVGHWLKENIDISTIFCSPLTRCIDSLGLLDLEAPFLTDLRLAERCFGKLEGKTLVEAKALSSAKMYYERYDKGGYYKWNVSPPFGESYNDLYNRLKAFVEERVQHLRDKNLNTLIMTHGGISHILRGILLGISRVEMLDLERQANGSLFALELNGDREDYIKI